MGFIKKEPKIEIIDGVGCLPINIMFKKDNIIVYPLSFTELQQEKEDHFKSARAKLLLSEIRMDSAKHAHILEILIDALKRGSPEYVHDYLRDQYVGRCVAELELKKYLKIEDEMIQDYEEIIHGMDNADVKLVFQYLVGEEEQHHRILKEVIRDLSNLGPPP